MNIFGSYFEYDGVKSTDINPLWLCTFDNSSESNIITKQIERGDFTQRRTIPNTKGMKYTEVLQFDVTIVKQYGSSFTQEEVRKLTSWLTSDTAPKKFKIHHHVTDETIMNSGLTYWGNFYQADYHECNSQKLGITFRFECNAPYGFVEEQYRFTTTSSSVGKQFIVNNTSDEKHIEVFPLITIIPEVGYTGSIILENQTHQPYLTSSIEINDATPLHMNNELRILRYQNGALFDFHNFNCTWFELFCGINTISIRGKCTVTMQCRYPRKVGA